MTRAPRIALSQVLFFLSLTCVVLALGGATRSASAQTFTTDDLTRTLAVAALESDFASAQPQMADTLFHYIGVLDGGGVGDLTLAQLAGEVQSVDWRSRLRWRQRSYEADFDLRSQPAALEHAVNQILAVVNTPDGLDDHLYELWGDERTAETLGPVTRYQEDLLRLSLSESLEKIRRYEIKYGPGSAKLNLLEALMSYGSQWVPGFGPDENGWPGPYEWIAGYNSTLLTAEDEELTFVSGAQFGIRRYLWAKRWPGLWNFIRPRHVAAGGILAGERNGPLVWPGRGEHRWGAFLTWGAIQVAYIDGKDSSTIAVTHTIQLFPGLF